MEYKSCYTCKYRKSYFGFPYCVKTPEKPARLCTFLSNQKCYEDPDYKHNFTRKPTEKQKEAIKALDDVPFIAGDCEHCIMHIYHLNYCTAFRENCNNFECYYLKK